MTTTFEDKYCDRCGEMTEHRVETNAETGWHRERCEPCWQAAVERSREESADV